MNRPIHNVNHIIGEKKTKSNIDPFKAIIKKTQNERINIIQSKTDTFCILEITELHCRQYLHKNGSEGIYCGNFDCETQHGYSSKVCDPGDFFEKKNINRYGTLLLHHWDRVGRWHKRNDNIPQNITKICVPKYLFLPLFEEK